MAKPLTTLERFRQAHAAFLAAAQDLRAELDPVEPDVPKDIARILEVVAAHYHLTVARILSPARDRNTATARHVAMALCRVYTRHSLEVIGAAFQRDHGCVMLAETNVATWSEQFIAFRLDYQALRKVVAAKPKQPVIPVPASAIRSLQSAIATPQSS